MKSRTKRWGKKMAHSVAYLQTHRRWDGAEEKARSREGVEERRERNYRGERKEYRSVGPWL